MEIAKTQFYPAGNLGEGGYGSVVRLYDEHGAVFAGKTFNSSGTDTEGSTLSSESGSGVTLGLETGILREMAFLAAQQSMALKHPNLLPAECVTELNGEVCVVLPQMQRSLEDVIEKKEWMSNPDRLKAVKQVLSALSWMHLNGFMHRDVKPANVLLDSENNVRLCDFSLVKPTHLTHKVADGKPGFASGGFHTRGSGTPTYTAPEVVDGSDYGTKADAYSAGVMMYELLNNTMLSAGNDKHAFKEVQEVRGRLSQTKPVPKVMAALLDPNPETRMNCEQALVYLQGEGYGVRGTHPKPPGMWVAERPAIKPCHGLQKAFREIDCGSAMVLDAAWHIQKATGAHPAECVFLAHKMFDGELINGHELVEGNMVEGLDDSYTEAEMGMLEKMQFDIYGVVHGITY